MTCVISRIENRPIPSNSFVISKNGDRSCVIIDPGTSDSEELITYLTDNRLEPEYILLTHEHFDHVWGVNRLKDSYSCSIVSSKICSEKIVDRKKNMSLFYDQVGFETYPADIIVDNGITICWNDSLIEVFETPGHTDGSLCFQIENFLFTGDTIIKDLKTVVKLPTGSKGKLKNSFSLLENKMKGKQIVVYPGHGESFMFDEIMLSDLL